eukprot:UN33190
MIKKINSTHMQTINYDDTECTKNPSADFEGVVGSCAVESGEDVKRIPESGDLVTMSFYGLAAGVTCDDNVLLDVSLPLNQCMPGGMAGFGIKFEMGPLGNGVW